MKIIVDAMGGDNAPQAPVMGAIQAGKEYGVEIILVGRSEEILKVLSDNGISDLPAGVAVTHASEVVEMCDDPATAFRKKKDSSLTVGLNLLKAGAGDAFVSAGSTGALLSGATLVTKRIKGIRRAALAPVVPTGGGGAVLIDCGANAECPPEYLLQFAYMGSYYAEKVLGRPPPKVGLLNIGSEEGKGTDLQRETYALLKRAGEEGRIRAGLRGAVAVCMAFCLAVSALVWVFAAPLMGLFVEAGETATILEGVRYLRIEGAFYCGIGCLFLLYGLYRAVARPGMSLVLTIISLGTRVLLAYTLSASPAIGTRGIWWAVPIGWILADLTGFFYCLLHRKTLFTGLDNS